MKRRDQVSGAPLTKEGSGIDDTSASNTTPGKQQAGRLSNQHVIAFSNFAAADLSLRHMLLVFLTAFLGSRLACLTAGVT